MHPCRAAGTSPSVRGPWGQAATAHGWQVHECLINPHLFGLCLEQSSHFANLGGEMGLQVLPLNTAEGVGCQTPQQCLEAGPLF